MWSPKTVSIIRVCFCRLLISPLIFSSNMRYICHWSKCHYFLAHRTFLQVLQCYLWLPIVLVAQKSKGNKIYISNPLSVPIQMDRLCNMFLKSNNSNNCCQIHVYDDNVTTCLIFIWWPLPSLSLSLPLYVTFSYNH